MWPPGHRKGGTYPHPLPAEVYVGGSLPPKWTDDDDDDDDD